MKVFSAEFYGKLIDQIGKHEGEVKVNGLHVPYRDSRGILTIGRGHNLEESPIYYGAGLTDEQADAVLVDDLAIAGVEAQRAWPWIKDLDAARAGVVVDMAFNMGMTRLNKFTEFPRHLKAGNYSMAAYEMLNSLWARQVKLRAIVLVKTMLIGEWHNG